MKIIEALKRLPVIEKRIGKQIGLIAQHSAIIDTGDTEYPFGTLEEQTKEVASMVQSVNDLVKERAQLRKRLAMTNATVLVKIGDYQRTITEWIEYRQSGFGYVIQALQAQSIQEAENRVRNGQIAINTEKGFKTVRFYDELERNEGIEAVENLRDSIDAELEKINAITDLVE